MEDLRGLGIPWTDDEYALIRDNPDTPDKALGEKLGRSAQAVIKARARMRATGTLPPFTPKHAPALPPTPLPTLPPGTYVEIIGSLLLDYPEVMACWLHAHGYSAWRERYRDPRGWVTLLCEVPGA